jgi:hypothetical protein
VSRRAGCYMSRFQRFDGKLAKSWAVGPGFYISRLWRFGNEKTTGLAP